MVGIQCDHGLTSRHQFIQNSAHFSIPDGLATIWILCHEVPQHSLNIGGTSHHADTKREYIHLWRLWSFPDHLGRDEAFGSNSGLRLILSLCEAKVGEKKPFAWVSRLVWGVSREEEDVRRLDISVNDGWIARVYIVESVQDLGEHRCHHVCHGLRPLPLALPGEVVKTAIVNRHKKFNHCLIEALAVYVWDDVGLKQL